VKISAMLAYPIVC